MKKFTVMLGLAILLTNPLAVMAFTPPPPDLTDIRAASVSVKAAYKRCFEYLDDDKSCGGCVQEVTEAAVFTNPQVIRHAIQYLLDCTCYREVDCSYVARAILSNRGPEMRLLNGIEHAGYYLTEEGGIAICRFVHKYTNPLPYCEFGVTPE